MVFSRATTLAASFALFANCSQQQPQKSDIEQLERAQTLYQNKNFEDALRNAEGFSRNYPDNTEAAVLVARIRFFTKDFSGAETTLRDYLKRAPENPYALMWLGRVISAQEGRAAEAAEIYKKVLAADPDNHFAHYYLGRSLESQGKLKEALSEYERSLAAEYQISKVHLHMARLFHELEMKERSEQHKKKVRSLGVSQADVEALSSL